MEKQKITNKGKYLIPLVLVLALIPLVISVSNISYSNPTSANSTVTNNTWVVINVSVVSTDLQSYVFQWNYTNYSLYDTQYYSLFNFQNLSALGENDTDVVGLDTRAHNGTVSNATWTPNGKYGGAFNFDGTNDYITISNESDFDFVGQDFSFGVWMKDANITFTNRLIMKGSAASFAYILSNDATGDNMRCVFRNGSTTNTIVTDPLTYGTGVWVHFACIMNATAGTVDLYRDGTFAARGYMNGSIINVGSRVTIGSEVGGGGSNDYNGTLDQVFFYNKSLTPEEIRQIYFADQEKVTPSSWNFYTNQSNLSNGNYTYQAFVNNASDFNMTGLNTVAVSVGGGCTAPAAGDWVITSTTCSIATNQIVPANLYILNGANVSISSNISFSASTYQIFVQTGSKLFVQQGVGKLG